MYSNDGNDNHDHTDTTSMTKYFEIDDFIF